MSRPVVEYRSRRADDAGLRERILAWARERTRYGYRRIHILLRREGWAVNRKRVYRIYREEALAVRRRRRKQVAAAPREALIVPTRPNERGSIDFMADTLAVGGPSGRSTSWTTSRARPLRSELTGRSPVRGSSECSSAPQRPRGSASPVLDNGPGSRAESLTSGPIAAASNSASSSPASPSRTRSSRVSTGSSATSV
jgi:hypothetical protein